MTPEILVERYEVEILLTHKSGERSLKAWDHQGKLPVFLREYDLHKPLNQERLGRYLRQAALLQQLTHPRIPALLDQQQSASSLLLVWQYIPGQSLADRQLTGWISDEAQAIALAEQILQSLVYLQQFNGPQLSFGLEPHHLLLDGLDRVWLTDFGGFQPVNLLRTLGLTLIRLLTGRTLGQLPFIDNKPAYQSFVSISNGFSRWLDVLLDSGDRRGFSQPEKALETLWKLQGKVWQPAAPPRRLPPVLPVGELIAPAGPWPLDELIDGHYRLQRLLGQGPGSWKYAGRDLELKQDVILKVLPLDDANAERLEPFQHHAAGLQELHHPQIPRFLRAFVTRTGGRAYWVIVHVLIAGQTLRDRYEGGWRPAAAELWDIIRQTLRILSYLHRLHPPRAHGNLHPANLVVNSFGRIWLTDFALTQVEPGQDLHDLAASLIYLLSGSQAGEFLAGELTLHFADGSPVSARIQTWLRRMLQAEPGQSFAHADQAAEALEAALTEPRVQPPVARPPRSPIRTAHKRGANISWEASVEQLRALGLHTELLADGGLELECPESKELSQWGRSKTIGMLFSPLRLLEESQARQAQNSKFFPLSGHRLEFGPEDIRLLKGFSSSGDKEILAIDWPHLLQAGLTPAPPKLLAALKDKVAPPSGTNFRLFHLLLAQQAKNAHCLLFLPPKSIPMLNQLIKQQLARA